MADHRAPDSGIEASQPGTAANPSRTPVACARLRTASSMSGSASNDPAGGHQRRCQYRPLLARRHLDHNRSGADRQRAEHAEFRFSRRKVLHFMLPVPLTMISC